MQPDNQSPQSQPLPPLKLSSEQKDIITAHASDAIQKIVGIRFTKDNKDDALMANAYEHGRLDMAKSILAYDHEQAAAHKNDGNQLLSPGEAEGIPGAGFQQAEQSNQTF